MHMHLRTRAVFMIFFHMNDLEHIDTLGSVEACIVIRSDTDILPDTLSPMVGHCLTLSEH